MNSLVHYLSCGATRVDSKKLAVYFTVTKMSYWVYIFMLLPAVCWISWSVELTRLDCPFCISLEMGLNIKECVKEQAVHLFRVMAVTILQNKYKVNKGKIE